MSNSISRTRITLSLLFLVGVCGILFLFWTMYQSYSDAGIDRKKATRALSALRRLEDFVDHIQTLESKQVNYLLISDSIHFQQFQAEKDSAVKALDDLIKIYGEGNLVEEDLTRVQQATASFLAHADAIMREHETRQPINPEKLQLSHELFDSVLAHAYRFESVDRALLQEIYVKRERSFTDTGKSFLVIFVLLILVSVLVFYLLVNEIRTRFQQKADQQKADSILNNITDPILVTNSAFQVIEWNAYAEVLYKLDKGSQTSTYPIFLADLFVNRQAAEEVMQALLQHSGWSGECLHKQQDGTPLFIQASCTALTKPDQQFNGAVIQVRDLTSHRESDVRANYLANLIATSKDAIFSTNLDQEVVSWNEAAEKLYSIAENDALGKKFADLIGRIDEQSGTIADDDSYSAELAIRTRAQKSLYVLADTIPVKNSFGVVTGYAHYHRDITLRKELEQKLRRFNEELSDLVRIKSKEFVDLVERIADGFIAFDADWRYTYINPKAAEILGVHVEESLGQVIWEMYPTAKEASFYAHYMEAQHKQVPVFVTEYYEPIQRWLEYAIYPSLTGTSVLLRDITDRHEAETKLRFQEQRFRDLVENLSAGVIVHGTSGEVTLYNETAARILGLEHHEFAQSSQPEALKHWQLFSEAGSLLHPEDFPVSTVLKTRTAIRNQVVGAFNRKEQRMHWALVQAYPDFDEHGSLKEVVVTFVDITEQKEAQLKMEESQARLNRVLLAMNEGWWEWDMLTDSVYYSPRWFAILGYEPDAFPKDSGIWNELLHPDDKESNERISGEAIARGDSRYEVESRLKHKDGHYVHILCRGFVQRDATGKPIRLSGINIDLTELRSVEQKLKQALVERRESDPTA